MKIVCLSFVIFLSFAASAVEVKKDPKTSDKKVTATNVDLDKLKKDVINEPKFSSESADQEKVDKELQKNNEASESLTAKHILDLQICGKAGDREKMQECQKNLLKK